MKKQIALAVSLSLVGSVISVSSAEAAGLFNDGDRIQGSSGLTGLYLQAIEESDDDEAVPALNYFGTTISGNPGTGLFIDGPDFTGFDYASISNPGLAPLETAETFIGLGSTGGFVGLDDAEIRSFQSGFDASNLPDFEAPTFVEDFLVMTGGGLTVRVDLNGQIESDNPDPGDSFVFEVPVLVTGDDGVDTQTVNGIFRFSTQDINNGFAVDPAVLDPAQNGEDPYTLFLATGGQAYSWELDVIKNVPEPSSMVSLLALGALGGGMAIKRKVSK